MPYLALCTIVKNETPYLREWVAYHTLIGVEHFFIYDNMSDTPVADVLKGYADPARVTIQRIHGKVKQIEAYQHCLDTFGAQYSWIGFIDLDEFVCPLHEDDLRPLLAEFETYAALGISWKAFSSNGHLGRPHGPVLKNYTHAFLPQAPVNHLIKCFIQPSRIESARNPHFCWYTPGEYAVTENHLPIPTDSAWAPPSHSRIQINHYLYKSQQDFEARLLRGRATTADPEKKTPREGFYQQLEMETVLETRIQRFLPPLEILLRKDILPHPYQPFPGREEKIPLYEYMDMVLPLINEKKYEQAAVCLCHASRHYRDQAELWVARAVIARNVGQLPRAELFLRQALQCDFLPNVYVEYTRLHIAQRDLHAAEAQITYLEQILSLREVATEEWQTVIANLRIEIQGIKKA